MLTKHYFTSVTENFTIHGIFNKVYPAERGINLLGKGKFFNYKEENEEIYSKWLDQHGMGLYFEELFKKESNFSEAKETLEKNLEIRRKVNNLHLISETLFLLGIVEEQNGNKEAETCL